MLIQYKIDVLLALKEKGYSSARIRKEKLIGQATLQRLRHNQSVSFEVLSKLCELLECNIGDILTYYKDEPTEEQEKPENLTEENETTEQDETA